MGLHWAEWQALRPGGSPAASQGALPVWPVTSGPASPKHGPSGVIMMPNPKRASTNRNQGGKARDCLVSEATGKWGHKGRQATYEGGTQQKGGSDTL